LECCKLLLQGADERLMEKMLLTVDYSGKTAVHFAAAAGHANIITYLAQFPICNCELEDADDRSDCFPLMF
jgi:ankyrin repeat protein